MTSAEVIDEIFSHLKESQLKSVINGGLYKMSRPTNSDKEDVVINCLGMLNEQLQRGVVNVNVFVPDLTIKKDGSVQKQPNFQRLKQLGILATSEVTGRKNGYWFDYQQDKILKDDASDQHYINIRIEFYALNF